MAKVPASHAKAAATKPSADNGSKSKATTTPATTTGGKVDGSDTKQPPPKQTMWAAIWAELRDQWAFWAICFLAGGMKMIVNQLEQPYARSLVSCMAPVDSASSGSEESDFGLLGVAGLLSTTSGSRWCGDRFTVLNEGTRLSAWGQAIEALATLAATALVSVAVDTAGRRRVMLAALSAAVISTLLLAFAAAFSGWSSLFFLVAQFLQGFLPMDYIALVICYDLAERSDVDGEMVFYIAQSLGMMGNVLWALCIPGFITMIELTDYRPLWFAVLLANVFALVVAAVGLPESRPPPSSEERRPGAGELLRIKAQEARRDIATVLGSPSLRNALICYLLMRMHECSSFMLTAQAMAYHGVSQGTLMAVELAKHPLCLFCAPLVGYGCDAYGIRAAVLLSVAWYLATSVVERAILPFSPWLFIAISSCHALLHGIWPLRGMIETQLHGEKNAARIRSLQWSIGHIAVALAAPFYANLFDAGAQSYWDRAVPGMAQIAFLLAYVVCVRLFLWSSAPKTTGEAASNGGYGPVLVALDELNVIKCEVARLSASAFLAITDGKGPLTGRMFKDSGLEVLFAPWLTTSVVATDRRRSASAGASGGPAGDEEGETEVQQKAVPQSAQVLEFPSAEIFIHWVTGLPRGEGLGETLDDARRVLQRLRETPKLLARRSQLRTPSSDAGEGQRRGRSEQVKPATASST